MTAIRVAAGGVALATIAATLALLGLAAASTAATDANVSIVYRAYQPSDLTIVAGQPLTWTNSGLGPHTVTSDAALFDSGRLEAGATFSYTFTAPGTYLYSCTVHPTMHGKVVVLA
ncbi:MAG TPA: cupredoxin domain-containing protein, partial [Solirubrobacteraceae bacterium]|nr:cupredoxin domain-containing protein [Solirubrobacteraceae bacterium]